MPDSLKPRVIPDREHIGGIEVLRLIVLALVCLAIGGLFYFLKTVDHNVRVNRETGYQSRAVNCQILQSLHRPLPAACLDSHVRRYMQ